MTDESDGWAGSSQIQGGKERGLPRALVPAKFTDNIFCQNDPMTTPGLQAEAQKGRGLAALVGRLLSACWALVGVLV